MISLNDIRNQDQWISKLSEEVLLFGLLGKLLYNAPDRETLEQLAGEAVFSNAPFAADQPATMEGLYLLQQWSEAFVADPDVILGAVQSDYTRLFMQVAGLPLAPWESVFYNEERLLFEESTLDVRRWYRRFGLEPVNLHKEPDDQIGLELLFIAHLAQLALKRAQEGDITLMEELLQAQRAFCRQHPLVWVPIWCDLMLEHARTDYYRGLALLVRGALTELATILDLEIAEPVQA